MICQCGRIFLPRSDGGKPAHVARSHARQLCGLTRTESAWIKALLPIASFRRVARAAIVTRSGEHAAAEPAPGVTLIPVTGRCHATLPGDVFSGRGRTAGQPFIRRGILAGVGNSGKMRSARGVHAPVVMAA